MRSAAAWLPGLLLLIALGGCGSGDSPSRHTEYAVQGAYSAAISPDSRYAIIGSIQHGGSLWDVIRQERLFNWNHKQDLYSDLVAIDFSPDRQFAITASQQDLVLWEVNSGKPHWFWSSPGGILDAKLAPNGNDALLGLDNHTAVYFDIKNGGLISTLYHEGRVETVDLSDDGSLALTGSDNNWAKLWDIKESKLLLSIEHGNDVNTVALSPNARLAFSAGQLDKALIWDTGSGKVLHTLTTNEGFFAQRISYTAALFSPTNDRLLTGTSAGMVQLWDVHSGTELRRWNVFKRDPFRPTSATIYALGFAGGAYYALASNGFINKLQ